MYNRVIGIILAVGAGVLVLLLAGVGSAFLTDDPPEVNPYVAPASAGARFVVSAVAFGDTGYVEVTNVGGTRGTLDGYWLCQFPAYHPISGPLGPGEVARFDAAGSGFGNLDNTTGEIGVYSSNSFDDPGAIVAYVEWGEPGHRRSGPAVEAGVWAAGSAVDTADSTTIVAAEEAPTSADGWTTGP